MQTSLGMLKPIRDQHTKQKNKPGQKRILQEVML
jgi:hypothetical protein